MAKNEWATLTMSVGSGHLGRPIYTMGIWINWWQANHLCLTRMPSQPMCLQVGFQVGSIVAQIAGKWFLACMNQHMPTVQICHHLEANRTFGFFDLAWMNEHMPIVQVCYHLEADWAFRSTGHYVDLKQLHFRLAVQVEFNWKDKTHFFYQTLF